MSDTSHFSFGKFVPALIFCKAWPGGCQWHSANAARLSHWVAPTLSVEELEKRIDELKAVQFWLSKNSPRTGRPPSRPLKCEKMTLATLKGMKREHGRRGQCLQVPGQ